MLLLSSLTRGTFQQIIDRDNFDDEAVIRQIH